MTARKRSGKSSLILQQSNHFILAFKIAFACNLMSGVFNNLNDCDEVYNYWEPLYFIVNLGQNGGFQTWEYSPTNGLRSYFYLWLFGWPAFLTNLLGLPAFIGFLSVRFLLAFLSALATAFLASILQRVCNSHSQSDCGLPIAVLFAGFTSLSPGNFISSTNLVPSGLCSTFCALMLSFWFSGSYGFAVGCVAFMGIVLWPFAALLGLPVAIWMIWRGHLQKLIVSSFFWATVLLIPMILVDSFHFGTLTVAPLNIMLYNVFTQTNDFIGSASQLYGIEPSSFYWKNYVLNQNLLIPMAFGSILMAVFHFAAKIRGLKKIVTDKGNRKPVVVDVYFMCLSPLILWNLVFFLQQHKEERFLFPCYPCLVLSASLFVHKVTLKLSSPSSSSKQFRYYLSWFLHISVIACFVLLSVARIAALVRWHRAPIFLTRHIRPPTRLSTYCLGREWHYFPSHFLLSGGDSKYIRWWHVRFLPSQFRGQLPGQYKSVDSEGMSFIDSTRTDGNRFNLFNSEEDDRYVNPRECDYLLDRDSPVSGREVLYVAQTDQWESIANQTTIESDSCQSNMIESWFSSRLSRFMCPILRSFYIPYFSEVVNRPVYVHLLRRLHT